MPDSLVVLGGGAIGLELAQVLARFGTTVTIIEVADRLLASGRRVDPSGVGVDTVGLDPVARSLTVDDRTRAGEGLWAVGDVTGHGDLDEPAGSESG